LERALRDSGLNDTQIKAIVEEVNLKGSCQDIPGVPDRIRHTFVVSSDVTVDEHIHMQAAMQRFVDNAISKTVNAPAEATLDDVAKAYMLGWKLGCKGLTVYVTGSREKVVLETHATAKSKQGEEQALTVTAPAPVMQASEPQMLFPEAKKSRPRRLDGHTYRIGTPLGVTYVTINENGQGHGQPFELFLHTSKAGSETAAISEAIGRLISLNLRLSSSIKPRERLKEIIRQLEGIGGSQSIGFGAARVRSLPDGVAQILQEYVDETSDIPYEEPPQLELPSAPKQLPLKAIGDLCPECGQATLVNEEGCRKCYSCGHSEC
jgi:ribonucleoside-diphosphate reductase alpha chain